MPFLEYETETCLRWWLHFDDSSSQLWIWALSNHNKVLRAQKRIAAAASAAPEARSVAALFMTSASFKEYLCCRACCSAVSAVPAA